MRGASAQDLSSGHRKAIDERLAAITELQKYIGQYNAIKKPRDKQKFYDANAANIILCRASGKTFLFYNLSQSPSAEDPSINSLKQEYATLLSEKKSLGNIKEKRETMIKWAMVKNNVERFLAAPTTPRRTHERGAR